MMVLVRIDSQSVVMALMQSSGGSRRGFPSAFRDMSPRMQSTCAVSVHWLQVVVTGSHVQLAHVTITIRCAPPVCRARRLDSAAAAVPARRRPRSFAVDRLHQLLSFAELCRAVVDGFAECPRKGTRQNLLHRHNYRVWSLPSAIETLPSVSDTRQKARFRY